MKFYTVYDVMEILSIKKTKAYEVISELNHELADMGYRTCNGRIDRVYFQRRYCYQD